MALFGSLWKAQSANTLHQFLKSSAKLMIVNDASVQKNNNSGFAWVLAHNNQTIWRGTGLAPGPAVDIYSGRAEVYGLLAAITFVTYYVLCYNNPIPLTHLTCYCDNIGVINTLVAMKSSGPIRPNDTTNDDHDIYLEIAAQADQCTAIEYQYVHVKGHQDKDLEQQLTIPKQHNVECDRLAKHFIQTSPQTSTDLPTPEFKVAQPHLIIQGRVIC